MQISRINQLYADFQDKTSLMCREIFCYAARYLPADSGRDETDILLLCETKVGYEILFAIARNYFA